jgi:hypothetical protein
VEYRQLNVDLFDSADVQRSPSVLAALEALSIENETQTRGAIFTRVEIVDFILDLVGYSEDQALHKKRLLEPAAGGGGFLFQAIGRLLTAWRASGSRESVVDGIGNAIRAIELHKETFAATRAAVLQQLIQEGIAESSASILVDRWLIQGDFLLENLDGQFDFVVGNPPYVRQELIPAPLVAEYRRRYQTLYDRADLYIPFIEQSLLALAAGGNVGFICSDRWMKNRYGAPLRKLIADRFHLKVYVDMVDTPAFHSEVTAYPAITVISREKPGSTRIAHRPAIDRSTLVVLAKELTGNRSSKTGVAVRELALVPNQAQPWLLEAPDQMAFIRRLESSFPSLEETGCKVGIGVATGADKAFIGDFEALDVEPDRKLPLVTTADVKSGQVKWRGQGVINPFMDDGALVDLRRYPRLRDYLNLRRDAIASRHCALKTPENWYRTIDRITPSLANKPKLLIPDIKGDAHIVFEHGKLYPHHNLYFITSESWDLRALQAVLLSGMARLFVACYSTKMRGGYLRFQAQYLRRIRIPCWQDVPEDLRYELIAAAKIQDIKACNSAASRLYGLTHDERSLLESNIENKWHLT